MSNEFKDWFQDRFANILLERHLVDKVIQTIIIDFDEWYAVVHGLKDGIHVKYDVYLDDREWKCERK